MSHLGTGLVVSQNLSQKLARHVKFATLNVDVSQQKPAPFKVFGVIEIPGVFGNPLQLVPGPRSLFQQLVSCRHT